jgi:hypothetical protein
MSWLKWIAAFVINLFTRPKVISIPIQSDVGALAGAAGAALTAAGKIAELMAQYEKDLNTPEMVNASEAQKLQAFKDRVNSDLSRGNETDLEKLEASQ